MGIETAENRPNGRTCAHDVKEKKTYISLLMDGAAYGNDDEEAVGAGAHEDEDDDEEKEEMNGKK